MLKVFRAAVTPPLFGMSLLGLALAVAWTSRIRAWLFLGIVLAASAWGLVRLHATGGYCTVRHGLVPGIILTLAAAYGLSWLMSQIGIPGRWLGLAHERLRPGPAVWAALLAVLVVLPNIRSLGPLNAGPYSVYHATGEWIAQHAANEDRVLDLTDWSLYFSQRPGYSFASVYDAPRDPNIRWIVVRKPHLDGRWHYSQVIRDLVAGKEPVAVVTSRGGSDDMQIRIYDRHSPAPRTADTTSVDSVRAETRRK
jgi:hypothetical protein